MKEVVENEVGTFYFQNGELHNLEGPAVLFVFGEKQYYIDGIAYNFEIWLELAWERMSEDTKKKYIYNNFEEIDE